MTLERVIENEKDNMVSQKCWLPPPRKEVMTLGMNNLLICVDYVCTHTYTSHPLTSAYHLPLSINQVGWPLYGLELWKIYAETHACSFLRVNYIYVISMVLLLKPHSAQFWEHKVSWAIFISCILIIPGSKQMKPTNIKALPSTVISHHVPVSRWEKYSWSVINYKSCNKYGCLHRISHWII